MNGRSLTTSRLGSQTRWLDSWTADQAVTVPRETVSQALTQARESVQGCDSVMTGKLLAQYLVAWKTPDDWNRMAPIYLQRLSDVPEDLVEKALIRLVDTHVFFPKVADIRGEIIEELNMRHTRIRRMEAMLKVGKWEEPRPKPTQAEKDEVHAMMDEYLSKFGKPEE